MKFFGAVGCVTNNKRLDFSGDPDHDADPRFKKRILPFGIGAIVRILLITPKVVDELL